MTDVLRNCCCPSLICFRIFDIAMEYLGINQGDFVLWKKYFKKNLDHGPLEKSKKLSIRTNFYVDTVIGRKVMEYAFKKLKKSFIQLYCTSTDPKERRS